MDDLYFSLMACCGLSSAPRHTPSSATTQPRSVSQVKPVSVTRDSGQVTDTAHSRARACRASTRLAAATSLGGKLRKVSPCSRDSSHRYCECRRLTITSLAVKKLRNQVKLLHGVNIFASE